MIKETKAKIFTTDDFKRWGAKGGKKTHRLYGTKKQKEWGKLGGRPRKIVDNLV